MAGIRFALYVDLMLLFGLPAFLLYNRRDATVLGLDFRRATQALAAIGLIVSVLAFAALCAAMAGLPLAELDRSTIDAVLWETATGTAWLARTAALLVVMALSFARGSATSLRPAFQCGAAAVALATLAWTGHGAAGSWARLVADIVHLLSAGVWVGAIGAFAALLSTIASEESRKPAIVAMLRRFATIGSLAVAAIIASGLVNAWLLVGPQHVADLWTTPYGQILSIKLVAFAGMLALAGVNRFRLTPRFESSLGDWGAVGAVRVLRRSIWAEGTLAGIVLLLVAFLGLLEPPTAF